MNIMRLFPRSTFSKIFPTAPHQMLTQSTTTYFFEVDKRVYTFLSAQFYSQFNQSLFKKSIPLTIKKILLPGSAFYNLLIASVTEQIGSLDIFFRVFCSFLRRQLYCFKDHKNINEKMEFIIILQEQNLNYEQEIVERYKQSFEKSKYYQSPNPQIRSKLVQCVIMEQLERRRSKIRKEIRRNELDPKIMNIRKKLEHDFRFNNHISLINGLISQCPAAIFIELLRHFKSLKQSEIKVFADAVCQYLTSVAFQKSSYKEGLPEILIFIYGQLSEQQRIKLPIVKLLNSVILQVRTLQNCGNLVALFDLGFQLTNYSYKQDKQYLIISAQQVQKVITKAHEKLDLDNLVVLALILANIEKGSIKNSLYFKLRQILRRSHLQIEVNSERTLFLRVLSSIGLHLFFEEKDVGIILLLLKEYESVGFEIILKVVHEQTFQSYLTYNHLFEFLKLCTIYMQAYHHWQLIKYFLEILTNLCYNNNQDAILVYRSLLKDRLYYFAKSEIIEEFAKLIRQLLLVREKTFMEQLQDCALKILKIGGTKISSDLSLFLSLEVVCAEKCDRNDLYYYIGKLRYQEMWDHYEVTQKNNNHYDL